MVLVGFWTYTCINWLRTLPYLRAWDAKYRDRGLTLIGVHTPEFGFERDTDNVEAAVRHGGIGYPVALDSGYAIWREFENHYWPAVYLADAQGRIRYHHVGEGEYAMAEMVVQQLLVEAGATSSPPALVSVRPSGVEMGAAWSDLRSPETYLGANSIVTSPVAVEQLRFGEPYQYSVPTDLDLNQWAPSGTWIFATHAALSIQPNARLSYRFHARDLHLVMGPASPEGQIPFRIFLDGEAPGTAHGGDVDASGSGTMTNHRLHHLLRQPEPVTDRVFAIEFLAAGAEVYLFSFG